MLIMSMGGLILQKMSSGEARINGRKPAMITHGIGLFLVLLGGFGMLARLGIVSGLPGWIYGKLAVWVLLGVLVLVIAKRPNWSKSVWWATITLPLIAAYLALYKPF